VWNICFRIMTPVIQENVWRHKVVCVASILYDFWT